MTITNHGRRPAIVEVTSYAEVVLPAAAATPPTRRSTNCLSKPNSSGVPRA